MEQSRRPDGDKTTELIASSVNNIVDGFVTANGIFNESEKALIHEDARQHLINSALGLKEKAGTYNEYILDNMLPTLDLMMSTLNNNEELLTALGIDHAQAERIRECGGYMAYMQAEIGRIAREKEQAEWDQLSPDDQAGVLAYLEFDTARRQADALEKQEARNREHQKQMELINQLFSGVEERITSGELQLVVCVDFKPARGIDDYLSGYSDDEHVIVRGAARTGGESPTTRIGDDFATVYKKI